MSKTLTNLECSITHYGEPTFDECYRSVKMQTYKPIQIHVIRGVKPVSASINKRHRLMRREFSVKVDADMILHRTAFEKLYKFLAKKGNNFWAVGARIQDILVGPIGSVQIHRTALIKDIVIPDVLGCDRVLIDIMKTRGYQYAELPEPVGSHVCGKNLKDVFRKFYRTGVKCREFNDDRKMEVHRLGKRWMKLGDKLAFYALAGFFAGLFGKGRSHEGNHLGLKEADFLKKLVLRGRL